MPDNTTPVKVIHRLSQEAYDELERKLQPLITTNNTTGIEAGFLLGQQSVMEKLRKGYVVG